MGERTAEFLKEILMEEYNIRQKDKGLVAKNIEKEIEAVDANMENALTFITTTSSEVTRRKLEGKIEELELRRQALQSQLTQNKQVNMEKFMGIAFEILKDPYSIRANGTIDDKRAFYHLVFRNNLQVNKKSESF